MNAWRIPESRPPQTRRGLPRSHRGVIFSAGSGWLTCALPLHQSAAMVTLRQSYLAAPIKYFP